MDSSTAAHALAQIAAFLELRGENRFKAAAYEKAARAVRALHADDLGALLDAGTLKALPGIGPATLGVIEDLVRTGESSYLERLRAELPEGLLAMMRIPGVTVALVHRVHEELGVSTVEALEAAARDGRLAALPRLGARTAEKVLAGIEKARALGTRQRLLEAQGDAARLVAFVAGHPDVVRAVVAGSVRRHVEIVGDIDVVAGCRAGADPAAVARDFAAAAGVERATGVGTPTVAIRYVNGDGMHLHCVADGDFPVALWRATGSPAHVAALAAQLASRGLRADGDVLRVADGRPVPVRDEPALYALAGIPWVDPALRESGEEVDLAAGGALPPLLADEDLRGVLHCHSTWSDGKATIREMALAARDRGWAYVGISDHSQAAFYAGGMKPDQVLEQHAEIEALNVELAPAGIRILKGIEADILADGQLDYGPELLARFDYVIGSVHSRFRMSEREMTDRVLNALDSPYLTILGHPTGRLLLSRDPYAIDVEAVLARAARNGVAVEVNADPHRLDLDWRLVRRALELGVTLEIGPDAHSVRGLDYTRLGVGMVRKGWGTKDDVLNARPVEAVLAFARRRRSQ